MSYPRRCHLGNHHPAQYRHRYRLALPWWSLRQLLSYPRAGRRGGTSTSVQANQPASRETRWSSSNERVRRGAHFLERCPTRENKKARLVGAALRATPPGWKFVRTRLSTAIDNVTASVQAVTRRQLACHRCCRRETARETAGQESTRRPHSRPQCIRVWRSKGADFQLLHTHYRLKNRDKYQENARQQYERNKERLKKRCSEYYHKNKEKIKERNKAEHTCICGCKFLRQNKKEHLNSLEHRIGMSNFRLDLIHANL